MKLILLFSTLLLATPFVWAQPKPQTAHPNFSGDWAFNLAESKADGLSPGELAKDEGFITRIVHTDPDFRIITLNKTTGGAVSEYVFYTDGRNTQENTTLGVEKRQMKWDRESLFAKSKVEGTGTAPPPKLGKGERLIGSGGFDGLETKTQWSLSADGNRLTEDVQITSRVRMQLMGKESVTESKARIKKVYDRIKSD